MKKIGLALGGGGAKGFAHIPILEVFDELGVKPAQVTGTSIGSIVGALYCSGLTAAEIAQVSMVPQSSSLLDVFKNKELGKMLQLIDPDVGLKAQGLLKGERFLAYLYDSLRVGTFEELPIPFQCVATDFWRYDSLVFDSGDLATAVRASMAIPYVFSPVILEDRILVDGGLTNNVPLDLLDDDCDLRIAINIRGERSTPKDKIPNVLEAIFHTYEVMQESTTAAKLAANPVDIYLRPPILDVQVMDFHRAEAIYQQGLAIKQAFKEQLETLLEE